MMNGRNFQKHCNSEMTFPFRTGSKYTFAVENDNDAITAICKSGYQERRQLEKTLGSEE